MLTSEAVRHSILVISSAFACLAVTGCSPAAPDSGTNPDGGSADDGSTDRKSSDAGISKDGSSDGGSSDAEQSSFDAAAISPACRNPDAGLAPYKSPASGTLRGSEVDATFCSSAYVELFSVLAGPPAHFVLDAFDATSVHIANPDAGSDPSLFVNVGIRAASPGVYTNTTSASCGEIAFDYDLPVPKGLVCSGTAPACSSGCSSACSGTGDCTPCAPDAPVVVYQATAAQDCIEGAAQTVAGSWTVTLTSVEPYPKSAATDYETYYVVHGTISATLPEDADGGTGSAAFALTF
jgi:hypothetical protein